MKVLGILGSPRRGGNSEILLDKALEGTRAQGFEVAKLILNELNFLPCQECGGCAKTGVCIHQDQMQLIYKKLDAAQTIILASPIFFGSLPAQVKKIIDRYQCRWVAQNVLRKKKIQPLKKGYLILVEASHKDKFLQNAESIVKNFFVAAGVEFSGKLYCRDIDEKAKILEHPEYLKQAYALSKK